VITRAFGPTGLPVAVIGQGTWRMGEQPGRRRDEVAALRLGIELGMTHIDTAEMYGDGGAERVVGEAIAGQRDRVFLASKVLPSNASHAGTIRACEASLRRLGTDHLDLYLLHWWSERHPIEETMRAMAELARRGLTRFVGVSNFEVEQLRQAQAAVGRLPIACNQVLYHLRDRAIEAEVLPHCERNRVAVVGYTPLARGGYMRGVIADIARRHARTPRQVALNFLTRRPALFTIPKTSNAAHVRENAGALDFSLTREEVRAIDEAT
jgi:diketogulonate reductase-like aldo/keto reductase